MRLRDRAWARLFLLVFTCLAGVWQSPAVALAADAQELIREGIEIRRRGGDDAAALQLFQKAFALEPSPRAKTQIGLAEQALGQWVNAYEHLTQALEASSDPWMDKNRAAITQALDTVNDHVGKIEILGGSRGAEVRIDSVLRGTLPLGHPVTVSTGTITIDLSAPGLVPVQRTTIVKPRAVVRESFGPLTPIRVKDSPAPAAPIKMAPPPAANNLSAGAPGAVPPEAPPTSIAPVAPAAPDQGSPEAPGQDSTGAGPSPFRSKAKWVAFGLGGAALAVGIVGLALEKSAASDFDSSCGVNSMGQIVMSPGSTKTASQCQDLNGQVDSNYRLEVIGLVGAGALVAAGAILWLTEPAAAGATAAASLSCRPGLTPHDGPWVGCALRF